jgi:hypothetical protein
MVYVPLGLGRMEEEEVGLVVTGTEIQSAEGNVIFLDDGIDCVQSLWREGRLVSLKTGREQGVGDFAQTQQPLLIP